ncbi:hypothetical protein BC835DRAFT_1277633 [Cytidiella melzeri]|nr:hypothetical protein BC835DRAFT_1277633 [Cytidiella melzeri]
MFTSILLATLLATMATVNADPVPTVPGPNDVYNEGSNCDIEWTADTSGLWTTMNIELMTGSNLAMTHLTTVTTVDGTDATKTSFTYPCPQVTPNSAIYFYQFTSPNSTVTSWTTRFAIADANGHTVAPANSVQPTSNAAIPWGEGALVNPSTATPPPTGSPGTNSSSTTASASSAISSIFTPPSSVPSIPLSSAVVLSVSSSASAHSSLPSSSSSSSGATANTTTGAAAANAAVSVADSRLLQAAVSLAAVAAAFVVAL